MPQDILRRTRLLEIADCSTVIDRIRETKNDHPEIVVAVRVELTAAGVERAIELAGKSEVEVIHVVADLNGNELTARKPRFPKEMIRHIHTALIEQGIRDEITLMAGGD